MRRILRGFGIAAGLTLGVLTGGSALAAELPITGDNVISASGAATGAADVQVATEPVAANGSAAFNQTVDATLGQAAATADSTLDANATLGGAVDNQPQAATSAVTSSVDAAVDLALTAGRAPDATNGALDGQSDSVADLTAELPIQEPVQRADPVSIDGQDVVIEIAPDQGERQVPDPSVTVELGADDEGSVAAGGNTIDAVAEADANAAVDLDGANGPIAAADANVCLVVVVNGSASCAAPADEVIDGGDGDVDVIDEQPDTLAGADAAIDGQASTGFDEDGNLNAEANADLCLSVTLNGAAGSCGPANDPVDDGGFVGGEAGDGATAVVDGDAGIIGDASDQGATIGGAADLCLVVDLSGNAGCGAAASDEPGDGAGDGDVASDGGAAIISDATSRLDVGPNGEVSGEADLCLVVVLNGTGSCGAPADGNEDVGGGDAEGETAGLIDVDSTIDSSGSVALGDDDLDAQLDTAICLSVGLFGSGASGCGDSQSEGLGDASGTIDVDGAVELGENAPNASVGGNVCADVSLLGDGSNSCTGAENDGLLEGGSRVDLDTIVNTGDDTGALDLGGNACLDASLLGSGENGCAGGSGGLIDAGAIVGIDGNAELGDATSVTIDGDACVHLGLLNGQGGSCGEGDGVVPVTDDPDAANPGDEDPDIGFEGGITSGGAGQDDTGANTGIDGGATPGIGSPTATTPGAGGAAGGPGSAGATDATTATDGDSAGGPGRDTFGIQRANQPSAGPGGAGPGVVQAATQPATTSRGPAQAAGEPFALAPTTGTARQAAAPAAPAKGAAPSVMPNTGQPGLSVAITPTDRLWLLFLVLGALSLVSGWFLTRRQTAHQDFD